MKQLKWLIATAILTLTLTGCSSEEEVIRVGTPYLEDETSGIRFHTDITDTKTITDLRDIIDTEKEVEQPADLTGLADTSFILEIPAEGVLEIWRYVWYLEDGSIILSNDHINGDENAEQDFFVLSADQTAKLKSILED